MTVHCEQQSFILLYFTDHAPSLWPPFPPLFSLTIPKKKTPNKKTQEQVTKNICLMKTSRCRDGIHKNQPNKMGMTPQYIIPTSCAILPCNYAHHKTLDMHIRLFTPTKRMCNYTSTRQSTLVTPQPST